MPGVNRLGAGRRALIPGATGGIGHAIARELARHRYELLLTGRRVDVLETLARDTHARTIPADLSTSDGVQSLIEEMGELDLLVANAALPASGEITDFSEAEIRRSVEVNLTAPILLARAAAEQMSRRGRGHIVFVSSLAGKVAPGGGSLYAATKFGLRGFALGLREDLRTSGVGVSVILPGFISDAGMFADSGVALPRGVGTKPPEDVARAVLRAVQRNRAEIEVAPLAMRAGTWFGVVAPQAAAAVSRRMGAAEVAARMTEGQRNKR